MFFGCFSVGYYLMCGALIVHDLYGVSISTSFIEERRRVSARHIACFDIPDIVAYKILRKPLCIQIFLRLHPISFHGASLVQLHFTTSEHGSPRRRQAVAQSIDRSALATVSRSRTAVDGLVRLSCS